MTTWRFLVVLAALASSVSGLLTSPAAAGTSRGSTRLSFPWCTSAVGVAPEGIPQRTAFASVPGNPFGVAVTPDGKWSFVALGGSVGVFSNKSFLPSLVRTIPTPGAASGEALTTDGRYLLVADGGRGAVVIDVARAERGDSRATVTTLSSPDGDGAVEVAPSADGRFAFVTLEKSHEMVVFDLAAALEGRGSNRSYVGRAPLGDAPVGLALSPDGRWLYVTSEGGAGGDGVLWVINVGRAETTPGKAVVNRVDAGCSPVRVLASPDGSTVWVAARGSNEVLAFSASALQTHSRGALVTTVLVGRAPVGLVFADRGRILVVADSNRFGSPAARGDLRVIDATPTSNGTLNTVAVLPAGRFPRDMALEPNGVTLIVSNYGSGQIESLDVSHLALKT
jgi:DNA-binding beta-propeller fold protein YncE